MKNWVNRTWEVEVNKGSQRGTWVREMDEESWEKWRVGRRGGSRGGWKEMGEEEGRRGGWRCGSRGGWTAVGKEESEDRRLKKWVKK
jgi:hypothetical protein